MDYTAVEQILLDHGYTCLGSLAKGGYACVYKIINNKFGNVYVAKAMKIDTEHGVQRVAAYNVEVDTLLKLIHPNIINIYDNFVENSFCILILEYCENGSLEDYIKKNGPLGSLDLFRRFFIPIIDALQYLHDSGISHSDLKPSNILLDSYLRPKLADFGLAQFHKAGEEHNKIHFLGSRPYMAPEVFKHQKYDPMLSDLWSLGITIYHATIGGLPWADADPTLLPQLIMCGMFSIPKDTEMDISKLIHRLCVVIPGRRITLEKIKKLPLIRLARTKIRRTSEKIESRSRWSASLSLGQLSESYEGIKLTISNNEAVMSSFLQLSKKRPILTFA